MADPTYQLILPPGVNQQEILDAIAKGQVALNTNNELVILDAGNTPQNTEAMADPIAQITQQTTVQVKLINLRYPFFKYQISILQYRVSIVLDRISKMKILDIGYRQAEKYQYWYRLDNIRYPQTDVQKTDLQS